MKFPTYPRAQYMSPRVSVIDSYVGFVGGHEADDRKLIDSLPPTELVQVAARIGRGCLIAQRGNEQAARKVFRRAQRDLEPHVKIPHARQHQDDRRAVQLYATAQMLEFHDDGAAVTEARHTMHLNTTSNIERLMELLSREGEHRVGPRLAQRFRGELVENIGLGIVTRFSAHPWVMGMSSLTHHDQGRGAQCHGNFDMAIVETSAERELTSGHKVQIKAGCLGICDEPQGNRIDRGQYNPDIFFLSGCCDLGIRGPRFVPEEYRLGELLVKEATDSITPQELEELDVASSSLLLTLTMDSELRQGTYNRYPLAG